MNTIGFTLGCFDILHIGHLNLLRNSKKYCDKLVVGVLDDNYMDRNKGSHYFSQQERIEILKSVKYCDVVVPENTLDKISLWKKYKFDYLFVGDDWMDTKQYKQWEKELKKFNCKVIYFPYTKGINSTVLRKNIKSK